MWALAPLRSHVARVAHAPHARGWGSPARRLGGIALVLGVLAGCERNSKDPAADDPVGMASNDDSSEDSPAGASSSDVGTGDGAAGDGVTGDGVAGDGAAGDGEPLIVAEGAEGEDAPRVVTADGGTVAGSVETTVTENCAATEVVAVDRSQAQPADIIFAIDTSGSMGTEIEFVQDYMNEFSEQIVESGIDVRVVLISRLVNEEVDPDEPVIGPPPEFGLGVCIAAPLGSGECPNDDNPPVYTHVPSQVSSGTGPNVILDSYPKWADQLRPRASKSIVIVTDDDADVRSVNDEGVSSPVDEPVDWFISNLRALDPEMWSEFTFNGIFCGSACDECASVGEVLETLVSATEGTAGELCDQDFQPVFDRLAEQIITGAGHEIACEWEIPPPPAGQSLSIDLVHVERSSDAGDAAVLQRVGTLAECAESSWYFDDPLNPTRIVACPDTCEAMQDQRGGRIDISFGCQVIEGCAESGVAELGASDDACTLSLPPPPAGVELDFSTINVRYDTELGFFGVLGVVPSADDCGDFEHGWYYDDADAPTSIELCPQTCDAYAAGRMNDIQAVFGCDAIGARPIGVAR